MKLLTVGRYCYGLALVGAGLMQLINGAFVRTIPALPAWLPASQAWPIAIGVVLVVIGGGILLDRQRHRVAQALVVLLALSFLFQRLPEIAANPAAGYVWTNPAKILALLAGAWVLAGWAPARPLVPAGLLAAFLILGGVQHFVYAGFVDTLVPAWIPPGQRFWTVFAGAALVAGGIGLLWARTRRVAGLWSGVMIFLWVVLLHIPRAVELKNASELAGVFEALALAGVAWLVADRRAEAS